MPPRAPQGQVKQAYQPVRPYSPDAYASEAAAPEPAYAPRPLDRESLGPEEESDEESPETEQKLSLFQELRRMPPGAIILAIAAVGSAGFLIAQVLSHTSPIPVLTSAGVITGLIYSVLTIAAGVASYRAAGDGLAGRSLLLALVGGTAAIIACGSFAGAVVLFLALGFK